MLQPVNRDRFFRSCFFLDVRQTQNQRASVQSLLPHLPCEKRAVTTIVNMIDCLVVLGFSFTTRRTRGCVGEHDDRHFLSDFHLLTRIIRILAVIFIRNLHTPTRFRTCERFSIPRRSLLIFRHAYRYERTHFRMFFPFLRLLRL
jgi:hypothetical protein